MGLSLALLAMLPGCHMGYTIRSTSHPEVDPRLRDPQLATICVLRPQTFGALAVFLHLDNNRLVGATQGSRVYFCYRAQPGWHQLLARSDNDAVLPLRAYAGQVHFVELKVNAGPDGLSSLPVSQGNELLQGLRYVVACPVNKDHPPPQRTPIPALSHPIF